jgi:hypothetical protein
MFSHYWIAIPDLLQSISIAMLHDIGAAEFLSAQVPQFMKENILITIAITYCFAVCIQCMLSGMHALFIPSYTIKKRGVQKRSVVDFGSQ